MTLDHRDVDGQVVKEGDLVRYGSTCNRGDLIGRVLVVEGPIPGSRATAEGVGTLYISRSKEDPRWDNFTAVEARNVKVVGR